MRSATAVLGHVAFAVYEERWDHMAHRVARPAYDFSKKKIRKIELRSSSQGVSNYVTLRPGSEPTTELHNSGTAVRLIIIM